MPQAADMINLSFLSDAERELILEVLQRDEELRQAEEQRVRKLKTDLLEVKRKGAKRGSGKYSQRSCGRCLEPLSTLTFFSGQCKMCNHDVCRNCRTVFPDGSWLCCVCAKESDVKKRTGDWFYDQRINRFSSEPAHTIVSVSLKKRQPLNKRETTGEVLLKSNDINSDPPGSPPVPQPRLKNLPENKDHAVKNSESVLSKESFESKDIWLKLAHSDTESAENGSLSSSRTGTESNRATPDEPWRGNQSSQSSTTGSSASSLTSPVKTHIDRSESANSDASYANQVKPVSPSPELDVDRLFKKSVKRVPKSTDNVSSLDRNGQDTAEASMGYRSGSVPGLDAQEEEEEEEDIDSLVSFHRRTLASSSSSLHSSKSALGSLMSIYSEAGDFDSVEVSGDIVFSLSYDNHTQSLEVFIKECRGLAYADASRQLSSPYVKCYLLPDKSRQSKRKTTIKRNTVNPVYKETLEYSISRTQLFTRAVSISVWHHGRLSRNAFLGEVEIPLDCRDLDSPYEETLHLCSKAAAAAVQTSAFAQYRGELVISLKYVTPKKPAAGKSSKGKKGTTEGGGELHVLIKEAKNLMAMKSGGMSDSFVKGYLYPTKAKTTKRKTPVVRKNLDPHYDHTFVYKDLVAEQLRGMCLELTVWDKEAMLNNEFLGGVRLSSGKGTVKIGKEDVEMDSVGEEVSLWEKMMQYPDSWAEGTLPLRFTMRRDEGK